MRFLFICQNLIGDGLYAGPALRKFLRMNYQSGDEVFMQTLPDHVQHIYKGMIRDMNIPLQVVFERPEGKFDFEHRFNVNAAFDLSDKEKIHIADCYARLLGVKLDGDFPFRLKPVFIPDENIITSEEWKEIEDLKGVILISAFSNSCSSRDEKHPGLPPNKMLPWFKWITLMNFIRDRYPLNKIRFLGAPWDMVPNGYSEGIVQPGEYMLAIPLNKLAIIMGYAKMLITIDNGMSHLAASQETPTFLMYPRCLGPHYICPVGNPNLQWIHMDPVRIAEKQVLYSLKHACEVFDRKG